MMVVLVLMAVLVISGLSYYAYKLTAQVKAQAQKNAELVAAQDEKRHKQQAYLSESLRVISKNVLDEDLNLSEAAIRCKMLLDGLVLPIEVREPFEVIETVYQQVKDFDTHQARKALSSQQRQDQDEAREAIEASYEAELKACFTQLSTFDWRD